MILSGHEKIGILGGTFDPIHLGHLILAQEAAETYDLARVIFIPCNQPPHKEDRKITAGKHRYAMVEKAVEGNIAFEISDIEIQRNSVSYAIDTLRELKKRYAKAELFFIIGADTLPELHLWKEINKVLKLCRFITFGRPGYVEHLKADCIRLDPPWPEQLLAATHPGRMIDISSSDIRYRIAEGLSIRYLVPPEVEMYIAEHNLFRA